MPDKKRVLLVDDEWAVTYTLQLCLEGTGRYEVKAENESLEALRTARMFQPHIVLLDVHMPKMDGGQVAALMRKDHALAGVPIVFLTAFGRPEDVEGLDKEIASRPYIAKPATLETIIEYIEEYAA